MTEATQRLQAVSACHYIAGEWIRGEGSRQAVVDPATESAIGEIAEATPGEIERAVQAARAAQKAWWATSALDRAAALHDVAQRMRAASAVVGEALTREMGKPFREGQWEAGAASTAFDYYAELARHDAGRVAGPAIAGQLHMTLKEPVGTVVSIVPFNFPLLLSGWQAAAALAAGNAMIVKPSELTSLATLLSMGAFEALPAGLVQVLCGGAAVGQALVAHGHTHAIAFTGSVGAAKAVAHAAADRFKPTLIEASGNDPFLVMPSAPIDVAVRGAAFAAFLNCGQVCTSAERFYVHEAVYDAFVEGLAEQARALRVGSGLGKVDIGPMASKRERDRVAALVDRAVAGGARVVCGASVPAHLAQGWFYAPTVLADVTPDMEILHGESFGPVAPVCKVRSLDEAIALANDSPLGLGANIYTRDLAEAMRAVNELECGIVWVNTPLNDNDAIGFGGNKMTGKNRELGAEGLEIFRKSKMVMIAPEAMADPEWFPYSDADAFAG